MDIAFWTTVDLTPEQIVDNLRLLDEAEQSRHARFVFPVDARDYAAAHGLLRRTLSRARGVPPEAWRFSTAAKGKPVLSPAPHGAPIGFSLAHTRGLVACAVADGAEVGVDVEPIDRRTDVEGLAARYFSAAEAGDLVALAPPFRTARFFELWVLKEAYLKAIGAGLSQPLSSASFRFSEPAALHVELPERSHWQFAVFAIGAREQYRLAVAIRPSEPSRVALVPLDAGGHGPRPARLIAAWPTP